MSNEIRRFTAPKIQSIIEAMEAGDWSRKETYADLLSQIHYYILHTTRILANAGARCPLDRQELHVQCMRHAGEEKGHENLSINDLRFLGFTPENFTELPATKNLYRNAYFLIDHVHPSAILGYAYLLETVAVAAGEPMVKIIEPLHGKKAVQHVAVHAKEDPHHITGVEQVINGLSDTEKACVREAIECTAHEFLQILQQVQARGAQGRVKKAS